MALLKHFAGFSVVEHGAQIVEQLIFRGTSSFAGEGIAFVARPAARIILPNGPMRGSSVAHHQEFTAVVPLGDASYGIQEGDRSEEHTSELQSRPHLVCRLLL